MITAKASLLWSESTGIGYLPIPPSGVYDDAYFQNYVGLSETTMGLAITRERIAFVDAHMGNAELVDVGIGCGHFVEERGKAGAPTFGYDVNPRGVQWLKERGLWRDPYVAPLSAVSLWDVLEHVETPELFISRVSVWLFVSIPIFSSREHVLRSKHFKPGEHCWYFTRDGLVRWMKDRGFDLVSESWIETILGREDIGTFAFRRS